jgi:SsrA-binding protein
MANKNPKPDERTIENRRARYDYAIGTTLEVGIKLAGSEVKSVRAGNVSLAEGYVRAEEFPPRLMLYSVNIGEYAPAGSRQHAATRARTLLANKTEIVRLARETAKKGTTIVPLKIYFKNGFAKLLVGVGTGKTKVDKRHSIAERESQRDIQRVMSKRV